MRIILFGYIFINIMYFSLQVRNSDAYIPGQETVLEVIDEKYTYLAFSCINRYINWLKILKSESNLNYIKVDTTMMINLKFQTYLRRSQTLGDVI